MKAAVCRAFGAPLSIETVSLDAPGAGQVAVRIAACAICHSDIAYADGAWGGDLPLILGHEASGHVTALGPGVTGLSVGDPVLVTLIRSCGTCSACASDMPTSCAHAYDSAPSPISDPSGGRIGQGMATGAFAEAVVVDHSQVVTLPKGIALDVACLLSCGVITGFGAVTNTAGLKAGETCAVIGTGGVGLNTIQGAALAGARDVIAIDIRDERLQTARGFGATHVLRGDDPGHVDALRERTGGLGVDYVFVTVGAPAVFDAAPDLLAPGGAMVMVGLPPNGSSASYSPTTIAAKNQRLLGSRMGQTHPQRDIPPLVDLYRAGKLQLDSLISGRYTLDQINEAIASARSGAALRNVIVFGPSAEDQSI